MGTWAHVVVVGGRADDCERAIDRLNELERRWSRFLPDSEISRLNRSPGGQCVVSSDTAALIARADWARQATAGRFDASILPALVAAGYSQPGPAVTSGFDPGGIGKGFAADLVATELLAAGAAGVCVNLGGDLRADGRPPEGDTWVIDVEDPLGEKRPLLRLGFARGAVATSSRLRRAWITDGEQRHHLIDPATGRPAVSDAVAATVLAGTAWRAEALATAAVIAGVAEGLQLIEGLNAAGLVVGEDGEVHQTAGLAPYLE